MREIKFKTIYEDFSLKQLYDMLKAKRFALRHNATEDSCRKFEQISLIEKIIEERKLKKS